MRSHRRWQGAAIVLALVGLLAGSTLRSGPSGVEDVAVTPHPLALPEDAGAVALARVPAGSLALSRVDEEAVYGTLISSQPLDAYAAHGLDGLRRLRDSGPEIRVALTELMPPVSAAPPYIGAGNNFRGHQEEVGLAFEPALFPKMSAPSTWYADITAAARLDYEVELCAVALDALSPGGPTPLGFVLCNDITDRWTMVRYFERGTPLGTTGFPEGKGGPGRLPIGPWMVIPEDPAAFAASVSLRLAVNGRQRQRADQASAIWDHTRIIQAAFQACGLDFRYFGEAVDWPACGAIPRGSLILGGTPEGVTFRLQNLWAGWLYLQPGDELLTEGTGLGRLLNRVVR